MRPILAAVVGAAVAGLGALILGEYPFSGILVLGSAVILGLFVSEAVVAVGLRRGWVPAVTSALLTAAGLVWAGWISEGHQLWRLPAEGWLAIALGTAAAGVRARWPRGGAGNRPVPAPPG